MLGLGAVIFTQCYFSLASSSVQGWEAAIEPLMKGLGLPPLILQQVAGEGPTLARGRGPAKQAVSWTARVHLALADC